MSAAPTLMFDLDGTLVDSAPSILAGFAAVLRETGIRPVRPLDASIIGPPLRKTLANISGIDDPAQIEDMAAAFMRYYDSDGCLQSVPYPGVAETLAALHASGAVLHLATNKRHYPSLRMLDHFGWSRWFTSIYALDLPGRSFPDKPSMLAAQIADFKVDKARACYIGDRDEDRIAADANGLEFIGVNWGYGDFKGEHLVIDAMPALLAWASGKG